MSDNGAYVKPPGSLRTFFWMRIYGLILVPEGLVVAFTPWRPNWSWWAINRLANAQQDAQLGTPNAR